MDYNDEDPSSEEQGFKLTENEDEFNDDIDELDPEESPGFGSEAEEEEDMGLSY